jgi:zinc/manganese transport system permease protein
VPADAANPTLSWNLARDVGAALEYHFMVNALLAGSIVAVLAGLIGWLMVLRRETFAGHTLSIMAFPGAAAATLLAVPAAWGYFTFCAAGAFAIDRFSSSEGDAWSEQSAGTGAVQALALAAGFLFVSLYGGVLGDLENLLFGNLLGVSDAQLLVLVALGGGAIALLCACGRPLLFASVDAEAARARGVPVRALAFTYLMLLGLTVAATSQITGVLLVFALLLGPAATARALTARPALSLAITVGLGLATVWLGLGLAYFSVYPAGFFIATISVAIYLLARVGAGAARAAARTGAGQRRLGLGAAGS